jgi:hypothetical protein
MIFLILRRGCFSAGVTNNQNTKRKVTIKKYLRLIINNLETPVNGLTIMCGTVLIHADIVWNSPARFPRRSVRAFFMLPSQHVHGK